MLRGGRCAALPKFHVALHRQMRKEAGFLKNITQRSAMRGHKNAVWLILPNVALQREQTARHPRRNLIGHSANVVGYRNEGPLFLRKQILEVGFPRRFSRMQHVPALAVVGVAEDFLITGDGPDVGLYAEFFGEQRLRLDRLVQNRAAAEQLRAVLGDETIMPETPLEAQAVMESAVEAIGAALRRLEYAAPAKRSSATPPPGGPTRQQG